MVIQGLTSLLKSEQRPVDISDYAGQVVAVDVHSRLYRGAFSRASESSGMMEGDEYVESFMNLVKMLLVHKVVPIIVFDGQHLPIKRTLVDARATFRSAKLDGGKALLNNGKVSEAKKCFRQAISITPSMVTKVIKELDRHNIQHIVSPYEVAPQLTYLVNSGQAKAVITEHLNVLDFGCSCVIFKMGLSGKGVQIDCKKITGTRNARKLRYVSILSGCDYLLLLPGIGLQEAQDIVEECESVKDILQILKNRFSKEITSEYCKKFAKADAAFLYQFVFDPTSRTYVRLNPLPKDINLTYLSGLGESPQNRTVALLKLNSAIHLDHDRILKEANKENIDPFAQLDANKFNKFEFDGKALQDKEMLLKKVEPVVKYNLPPPPSPSSSSPRPHMFGPKYISSRLKSITKVNSSAPSVNIITTKPGSFLDLWSKPKPKAGAFTVWKDKEPPKKPTKAICRPRSPPPSPSFTPTAIKYQLSQKRKSLLDDYPNPFAKVKKSFALDDTSVVRRVWGMTKVEVAKDKVECESIQSCDATLVAKAEDVLYNVRVAVVGIGLTHSGKSGKPISTRSLSARLLVRNNKQDLINDRFKEISRTFKTFSDLVQLDTLARYDGEHLLSETIFSSHAPLMIDQTKIQLELYFKCILASLSKLKDIAILYDFLELSSQKQKRFNSAPAKKEGYLSKKEGKLFGKWKARYFILNSSSLECYSSKGGDRKGVIELTDALVGRQAKNDTITTDYRHALTINELVTSKQFNRHLLCAYDDEERDAWADAIVKVMQSLDSTPAGTSSILKRLAKKEDYSYNS
ncbi:hypothetical protein MFLAVUS_010599 [Mucor flavus]|uniref:Exonuclease 1 n=1 Tax=Mucor flavus TaxID=439312 RepID=A0ABP9ZD86_9FUNG